MHFECPISKLEFHHLIFSVRYSILNPLVSDIPQATYQVVREAAVRGFADILSGISTLRGDLIVRKTHPFPDMIRTGLNAFRTFSPLAGE